MLKGKKVKISIFDSATIIGTILDEDEWGFIIERMEIFVRDMRFDKKIDKHKWFEGWIKCKTKPKGFIVERNSCDEYKKKIHISRGQILEMEVLSSISQK